MRLEDYFAALRTAHGGQLPLNTDQRLAIEYTYTSPLWIIAGPGTGKTHTLVWLVLKRMLVDGIPGNKIVLTTFTRKAAAELESRLIHSKQRLQEFGVAEAEAVDVSQIIVGTLHSICSRILQDQRYEPTLRVRVLEDELTQQFFVRRSKNPLRSCDDVSFWRRFGLVGSESPYPPAIADRVAGAAKLFNRLTENSADTAAMLSSGDPHFELLAHAYEHYRNALQQEHRTDQAHLQLHFLSFLATPPGQTWLHGGGSESLTVLVDEYQDTNPIQEQIYFKLAERGGDITVVGDDDQSLYRFRGATVESLIDFDRASQLYLKRTPVQVNLRENRRSHPGIVTWVNRFIEQHPKMKDQLIRVRAPNKRPLVATSDISGPYPSVMAIVERANPQAAHKLVQVIQELFQQQLVTDYSQIALLTFSTRETSHGIGTFTTALRDSKIPLYNPRNGSAHKDEIFLAMLGSLMEILDPVQIALPRKLPRGVPDYIRQARDTLSAQIAGGNYPELEAYIRASARAISAAKFDPARHSNFLMRKGGRRVTISGLLYKLLAYEPFASRIADPEAGERLKALNLILADYESLYDNGEIKLEQQDDGRIYTSRWTLYDFYAVFVEGVHDKLNDPEDDEVSVQLGMVNVMTIHQAKGLEFEVVFVLRPDRKPWVGDTHIMEDELDQFISRPTKPRQRRSRELRAAEDAIRLFFVAYSRAKRLLIITGSKVDDWADVLGNDQHGNALADKPSLERAGVHVL